MRGGREKGRERGSRDYYIIVFLRVAFTKKLIEMASLGDSLDPTDLLILHEEVGTIESNTNCALAQLKVTASSGKQNII